MKRYLLLFLTCVSISLSMTSCMPRLLVSEMGQPDGSDDGISLTESSRAQDERRYDFSLKLGRKELSGIMVARTVSPGTVRVVGATYRDDTLRYDIDKGFIYNEFGRRASVREGVRLLPRHETP